MDKVVKFCFKKFNVLLRGISTVQWTITLLQLL